MKWLARKITTYAETGDSAAFLTQPTFDRMADRYRPRSMHIGAGLMIAILVALTVAVGLLAPKLLHDGHLLWFGVETKAVVRTATLTEQGRSKTGTPRYRLVATYEFRDASGTRREGTASRNDLSTPVHWQPGETIMIHYDPAQPTRSTLDHNLRIDVYALLLFLPFLLLVPGGFGGLYLYRYLKWRRRPVQR